MADPTLREMRATLSLLRMEASDVGSKRQTALFERVIEHMEWLLDSYLFDSDECADDGGRADG